MGNNGSMAPTDCMESSQARNQEQTENQPSGPCSVEDTRSWMSKELEAIGQTPREERVAEGSQESPAKEAPPEGSKVLISAALGANSPKAWGKSLTGSERTQLGIHSHACPQQVD